MYEQNYFKGLLLKESLRDLDVLNLVKITKIEKWDVPDAVNYQPKIWTAISFEGEKDNVEEIVEKMSKAIKEKWYLNISTENMEYVVFFNKIFKYPKGNDKTKKQTIEYGISIGIPKRQLDL